MNLSVQVASFKLNLQPFRRRALIYNARTHGINVRLPLYMQINFQRTTNKMLQKKKKINKTAIFVLYPGPIGFYTADTVFVFYFNEFAGQQNGRSIRLAIFFFFQ